MKKQKTTERTIRGIVVPAKWDDDDNVVEVAIETEEYEEYLVEPNKKGMELLAFINSSVEAEGTVRDVGGKKVISVRRYESLEEYEEDDFREGEEDEEEYGYDEEDER